MELGALPGAVPCARLHARHACMREWGLAALGDGTELAVSELMTNAVQVSRAMSQAAPVRLWLLSDGAQLVILVWDASPQPPVRLDAGNDAENGRGLLLVTPSAQAGETRAGQLFAGRGGVVYRLKGESLDTGLMKRSWAGAMSRALYEDHAGQLWLGTELGAAVVPDDIVSHVIPPRDLPFGRVRAVLEASSGTLWFGTVDNGLVRLEPKAEPGDGLHPDATSAKRFTEGQRAVFTVKEGLPSNSVWAIYEDADGVLWLGTENGLSRYTAGRFFNFNHAHGLREGVVNQVLEDDVRLFVAERLAWDLPH